MKVRKIVWILIELGGADGLTPKNGNGPLSEPPPSFSVFAFYVLSSFLFLYSASPVLLCKLWPFRSDIIHTGVEPCITCRGDRTLYDRCRIGNVNDGFWSLPPPLKTIEGSSLQYFCFSTFFFVECFKCLMLISKYECVCAGVQLHNKST